MLFLSLFSFWVTSRRMFSGHVLYWDNAAFFSVFRDQLHSLNYFGEIAWWFPHVQSGWPAYYYSILGDTACGSPLFVVFGFASWLVGQLGWHPGSFHSAYVIYFGLAAPLIVIFAARSLAFKLFKTQFVIFYVISLVAFSPAVLLNVSDVGFLEPLAYSFFFFSTLIQFVKLPGIKSFWLLGLAICLLAVSLNYPFLFWNIIFIPLGILVFNFIPLRGHKRLMVSCRNISIFHWVALALVVTICCLPSLLTLSQAGEMVRSTIGEKYYQFSFLKPGNPFEFFSVSLPFFGFEWRDGFWRILPGGKGYHICVNYLGLLALPLTFVALLHAKIIVRLRILVLVLAVFCSVLLVSYSPFFGPFIWLPTPLKGNSHFSDGAMRAGGFLILVYASGCGLSLLLDQRHSQKALRTLKRAFSVNAFMAVVFFVYVYFADNILGRPEFGFLLILILMYFTIFYWIRIARSRFSKKISIVVLIALAFFDITTHAFIHMRQNIETTANLRNREEVLSNDLVGLIPKVDDYAPKIVMSKKLLEVLKHSVNLNNLPEVQIFTRSILSRVSTAEDLKLVNLKAGVSIDRDYAKMPEFSSFFNAQLPALSGTSRVQVKYKTYNRLSFKVQTDRPSLLFVRDGFSPHWKATVNGVDVPVGRAWHLFKVLPVPAGNSVVNLAFSPPWVPEALAASYFLIFLLCIVQLALGVQFSRRNFIKSVNSLTIFS